MRNPLWLRNSSSLRASVLIALAGGCALIQATTLPRSRASTLAQVGQLYEETRIAGGPGVAGGAEMPDILAVASDGTFFVFTDPETFDLSTREIETGIDRNLTNRLAQGDETYPGLAVASPDSERVAYSWGGRHPGMPGSELRVIDRRGGNPVVLYDDPLKREVIPFDWWPDGKALLVGLRGPRSDSKRAVELVRVSTLDRTAVVLSRDWPGDRNAISPDGRYILYDRPVGQSVDRDLFVANADGSRERALVSDPQSDDIALGWFAAGTQVLYNSRRADADEARVVNVRDGRRTGDAKVVQQNLGHVDPLGTNRSDTWYLLRSIRFPSIFLAELDPRTGKAVGGLKPIPGHPSVVHTRAIWSPTGDRLAYTDSSDHTTRDRLNGVVVLNVASGRARLYPVPSLKGGLDRVVWSPDERSVAFEGMTYENQHDETALFRLDLRTGRAQPEVVLPGQNAGRPWFSPDGLSLFYTRYDPPRGLIKRNLKNRTEEVVTTSTRTGAFALSPDGREFVFPRHPTSTDTWFIEAMPATGGDPRTLVTTERGRHMDRDIAWSPDGKYVLFRSEEEVFRVSREGGIAEPIGISLPYIRSLSMRPDGRQLAVAGGDGQFEVVAWRWKP